MNKVLRFVGGPYDGGVQDVDPATTMVQMGVRRHSPKITFDGPLSENDAPVVSSATYRRRSMQFEDGGEPVEFLCWSEFTDREAMLWLLKQPAEDADAHRLQ